MQRHKLGAGMNSRGGSNNPQPSPASWQVQDSSYGGIKLYDPNVMFQQNLDANHQLTTPQSTWTSPAGLVSESHGTEYSQSQQWNWTNGAQPAPMSSTWNWENSRPNHAPIDHHLHHQYLPQTQLSPFDQTLDKNQPQQQIHWNTASNHNQGTIHRSFSDVWNWGDDNESNTPMSSTLVSHQESQGDVSQQLRQGPDGQDQWAGAYQNWNAIQQTQYSWSQSSQPSYQTPAEMQSSATSRQYSVSTEKNRNTEMITSVEYRETFEGKVETESNQSTSLTQPVQNLHNVSQPGLLNLSSMAHANSSQEVSVQDSISKMAASAQEAVDTMELVKNDCTSSVTTFFHSDSNENDIETREGLQEQEEDIVRQDADASKMGHLETSNPSMTEPESIGCGGIYGRAPFLRCDSWISNSSLLTYNHSTTGSQEFLSGSFFGEDGPASISSVTGICHSIDDMHISSPKSLHPLHHHPLLLARRAPERPVLLRRRSSVEEQILSLPLDATSKLDTAPLASDTRRSSLPNVAVLTNSETASEIMPTTLMSSENNSETIPHPDCTEVQTMTKDVSAEAKQPLEQTHSRVIQGVDWNQEPTSNEEIPLLTTTATNVPSIPVSTNDDLSSRASGTLLLTENVEVVPVGAAESHPPATVVTNSGSYKKTAWSREGSAFQPLLGRTSNVTPVIQREVPDELPSNDGLTEIRDDCLHKQLLKTELESANLETVPDNVERPLDGDISENNKKTSVRSPLHSSFSRQHLRETHNSSPAASLWENPELAQDFGVVLAPAVLPSGSKPLCVQQSALLVPQLQNQQELLDNPLGVSRSSPQPVSIKPSSPSVIVGKSKSDSHIQAVVDVSSAKSDERAMAARSSVSPPSAPLDLSSRAAPQGQSAADDDKVPPSRLAPSARIQAPQNPLLPNGQPAESDRKRYMDDRLPSDSDRRRPQRTSSIDDYSENRNWTDRSAYVADIGESYDQRGARRNDVPPVEHRTERERTWKDRSRDWERGRDWQHSSDSYYQYRYDNRSDRERSRPSSRASNQDYEPGSRDGYYERSRYPPYEDVAGREAAFPMRPSSRSGYESDQGSSHRRRQAYDSYHGDYYQQDPRYSASYSNYYRYSRDPYDPRQYSLPYYGANQYNYGYYAELYGSDPRYRAYYDSMAKDYYWQYGSQYRLDDYDRRSVHSGRSSVTDDSQKENENFIPPSAFHNISSSRDPAEVVELSTIYPPDNAYYPNGIDVSADSFEQLHSATVDVPAVTLQRLTPAKFSTPHMRASFNPSGQLIVLPPNSIVDGQVATVEICDIQGIFADDPVTEELNSFPSPLIRAETHKNDVIQYCLQKIRKVKADQRLPDRDSCVLIWELLVLLIRQNGVVVGTDIAELLLSDRNATKENIALTTDSQLIDTNESLSNDTAVSSENSKVNIGGTHKFIEFLLFGHKKDGLEWAMKQGLWGHALFLASKMDPRTYTMVMTRFANSLAFNDPLQTLYQLMSGRQPAAVTCIADEKWGDWRPHLAIILSNPTHRPDLDCRSVITLGDTLAAHGYLHAAHFCYLMAQVEFGSYDKKSSKLVLIGANHSLPFNYFATIEAIKCTEVYEYVQSLANPQYVLPHLQLYKFIYATRLAEHGRPQEALYYCEVITRAFQKMPTLYDVELVHQVYELSNRLKYFDPYYTQEEGEVAEMGDPFWLRELKTLLFTFDSGTVQLSAEYCDPNTSMTNNTTANVCQLQTDYNTQNTALETGLQGDGHYQQLANSYTSNEQGSAADTSQQYLNYFDNSQQQSAYSDDRSIQPQTLSAVSQLNYSESYSENAVPLGAEDYASQNLVNSQYDYYGTAINSHINNTIPDYNNLTDGTSAMTPDNVEYYSTSSYKPISKMRQFAMEDKNLSSWDSLITPPIPLLRGLDNCSLVRCMSNAAWLKEDDKDSRRDRVDMLHSRRCLIDKTLRKHSEPKRPLVFGGTFPIDEPVRFFKPVMRNKMRGYTRNLSHVGHNDARKTFPIDCPVRRESLVDNVLSQLSKESTTHSMHYRPVFGNFRTDLSLHPSCRPQRLAFKSSPETFPVDVPCCSKNNLCDAHITGEGFTARTGKFQEHRRQKPEKMHSYGVGCDVVECCNRPWKHKQHLHND